MVSGGHRQPAFASESQGSLCCGQRRGCDSGFELLDTVATATLAPRPPSFECMPPATSGMSRLGDKDAAADCFAIGTPTGSEDAGGSECSFCIEPVCLGLGARSEDSSAHFTIGTPQGSGCQVQADTPSFCLGEGGLPCLAEAGESASSTQGQCVHPAAEKDEEGEFSDFSDSELDLPDCSEFNWYTSNVR
eukprot:TRINITY_DN25057_c0_g1_i1.p1 TRINITY_DN25057_c0_g1~~TRINITY_DN25057_c0_g1_i1.p1  ORF type:complete len:208 (+),score=27.36 TRINITY_DN25057_c0_g1_i1:53-625(+)